jgi:hypothetical protein
MGGKIVPSRARTAKSLIETAIPDRKMSRLTATIDALVYLSVAFGAALLVQAFSLLPAPVAYSIVGGWLVYIVAALLVFRRVRRAYVLVLVLAVLTLVVSLPQPAHYSLLNSAQALAGATFLLGSAAQIGLIVLIPIYFVRQRKPAGVERPKAHP